MLSLFSYSHLYFHLSQRTLFPVGNHRPVVFYRPEPHPVFDSATLWGTLMKRVNGKRDVLAASFLVSVWSSSGAKNTAGSHKGLCPHLS